MRNYNFIVFEVKQAYDCSGPMSGRKNWCASCSEKFPVTNVWGYLSMQELPPVFGESKVEVIERLKKNIQYATSRVCQNMEMYSVEVPDEK